ncbi:MAG TPA: type II toxin-antitoxin system RelE/ParE family toxin [Caulobacteraceae bacterium]|jgi:toxin ParE1/3/4|nr:type II toxin-antitoxin system RelE/ParE family toxin [Caulobacteraceae bacterium]
MKRYRLSRVAQADLDSIWDYSATHWGDDQAERYVRDIQRAIEAVASNPCLGRACDEIRTGYFKRVVGSHVLFYRLAGEQVEIIRILHQRMDFDRHL